MSSPGKVRTGMALFSMKNIIVGMPDGQLVSGAADCDPQPDCLGPANAGSAPDGPGQLWRVDRLALQALQSGVFASRHV